MYIEGEVTVKIIQLKNAEKEKIELAKQILEEKGFECTINELEHLSEMDKLIAEKKLEFQISNLQQQIIELENLYNQLTNRVRGFIKMEVPSCKMILVDRFLEELSGYPVEEWTEIPNFISTIIHPDFEEYYHEKCEEIERGIVPKVLEYKIVKKTGEERWWLQFNIGAYNIEGKLISLSGVIIDNTEHKETQIKYQNLFENLNAGVFRTNIETGEILEVNQKIAEAAGFTSSEEFKENSNAIDYYFNPEDRNKIIDILKTKGKVTDYEVQLQRPDGSTVWVSHSASLYPIEGYCEGIIIDITDRKNAELKLKESEEKFRSLIEQSVAGIIIVKDNKIIYANDVIFKHSGYSQLVISNMDLAQLKNIIHPDDVELVMEQFKKVEELGEVPEFYCRIVTQENNIIWLSSQLKTFSFEGGTAIAVIMVEITKRMELEQKNRKERELIEKYFDVAGVLLVVLDRNCNVVQINKRGCEILGYSRDEIIGKNWIKTFLPKQIQDQVLTTFTKVINDKISPEDCYENYILTKSGEKRLISWHNATIKDQDGLVEAVISSGEDITEWRLAEQMLQDRDSLK
ncbi:MAG: PAS domain S-box protein [Candidatus Heimdallarchaeota archaeon]|nr:PAS domain S-box protein [Candidatus Heimdallarchaeota archaeon]